jgi:transposase
LAENQSRAKIAKNLGVSKATLYKWLHESSTLGPQ